MNWQRIARKIGNNLAKMHRQNCVLRDRVLLEQKEVRRLGQMLGHSSSETQKQQDYFWKTLP